MPKKKDLSGHKPERFERAKIVDEKFTVCPDFVKAEFISVNLWGRVHYCCKREECLNYSWYCFARESRVKEKK